MASPWKGQVVYLFAFWQENTSTFVYRWGWLSCPTHQISTELISKALKARTFTLNSLAKFGMFYLIFKEAKEQTIVALRIIPDSLNAP